MTPSDNVVRLMTSEERERSHEVPHLRKLVAIYEQALLGISGPLCDPSGLDWRMQAYREAGGGYEGLQAIADAALAAGNTSEGD